MLKKITYDIIVYLFSVLIFSPFRYLVKVTIPLIATVQVQTSKSDTIIKLQLLDSEEEMASSTGKGHVIIPAFHFISSERPLSSLCQYSMLLLDDDDCDDGNLECIFMYVHLYVYQ